MNWTLPYFHGGSLEIELTVPLRTCEKGTLRSSWNTHFPTKKPKNQKTKNIVSYFNLELDSFIEGKSTEDISEESEEKKSNVFQIYIIVSLQSCTLYFQHSFRANFFGLKYSDFKKDSLVCLWNDLSDLSVSII